MEKLILTSGRFTPPLGEGTEARVRAMERYLADLSEEMELLIARIGRMQESAAVTAQEEG